MRKAEDDISAQKDFGLFSTSPPISSRSQAVETKEMKQLSSSIFTTLPHFTDLTTYTIKNIINFGKALTMFRWILWPYTKYIFCLLRFCNSSLAPVWLFRALNIEDQISLLKGATFEIILIHFNMFFNEETNIWECGPLQYCMDDAFRGEALYRSPWTSA